MTEKPTSTNAPRPRRPLWVRLIKWIAVTCVSVIAILLLTLGLIVWILTPEKLTPIVNRYASEYLEAEVCARRVELTVWSSFPELRLQIDTLTVRNTAIPDTMAGADTLLCVPRFGGAVNLAAIPVGRIELYDVELCQPYVNLVQINDSTANYDILPSSEPDTDDAAPVVMPTFAINRFTISGDALLRYTSVPDSIYGAVTLHTSGIDGTGAPLYKLAISGNVAAVLPAMPRAEIAVGLDGGIRWSPDEPSRISLHDFNVSMGPVRSTINLAADMNEPMQVEMLDVRLEPMAIDSLIAAIPPSLRGELDMVSGDISVSASAMLTEPFRIGVDSIPSFTATIDVPDGRLNYDRLHLTRAGIRASATVNGADVDRSVFHLERLTACGIGIDMTLSASVTSPLSDPAIDGRFNGTVNIDRLPRRLLAALPYTLSGQVKGDAGFTLRRSDLSARTFHRAKLTGTLRISDFHAVQPDSLDAFIHRAELRLGTNDGFVRDSQRIDSLLTLSVKADTSVIITPDIDLTLTGLKMGAGCRNVASSADTTRINPIEATISIDKINCLSRGDSSRIRLREVMCGASISRFNGMTRVPQLRLNASASGISYADRMARLMLRGSAFDITAHLNPPPRMSPRIKAKIDSVAALHPGLSRDSVMALAFPRNRHVSRQDTAQSEYIDMAVDKSISRLLRQWDVRGSLTARSGRAFTPLFPLRNRFTDLDCRFTTDSIDFRNVRYTAGQSDFTIRGTVSNIRRALTSRRHSPIRIELALHSDTININEITQAVFRGATFATRTDSLMATRMSAEDYSDDALQHDIEATSDEITGPVLIPLNISAGFDMTASHVIYSDVPLHDFRGQLLVDHGAVNINELSARTDIGTASLNAIYYAPRPADMMFGMGMKLNGFHIDKVMRIIPEIDTIMPLMKDFSGIIDADLAATTRIDTLMNFDLPTLRAALKLSGDSLVVLDHDTFRTLSKWLMFKDKGHNMIDHMEVEMVVENSVMELYPFMFDMDRYRLGVMGSNDLAMNLDYHISVLKSPLPFKFGINIKGTADDMKIRLGGAKFKENMAGQRVAIADTTRINLINEINRVFHRGADAARLGSLPLHRPKQSGAVETGTDTISAADSLIFIREGLIAAPAPADSTVTTTTKKKRKK